MPGAPSSFVTSSDALVTRNKVGFIIRMRVSYDLRGAFGGLVLLQAIKYRDAQAIHIPKGRWL